MRVAVDEDRCIAAGQCAALAPHTFDQRDEDVVLLDEKPHGANREAVRAAAAACPALAIALEEGETS
jgi:ferredoxin